MKRIFNKRSFHFFLKSLSPFSHPNPNPNFINYYQQIRLIRTITPLISNSRSFNGVSHRTLSTRLSEPNNKPNDKTILLPGCDLVHWLVVVDQPGLNLTRDQIIHGYIKTLATVVASEEEARMKLYSVSTKHYFAFGALVSEELAYKLKELPHVCWVLPDSYLDVKNQTYAGEPFINGEAVPYDSKYHAIWLRNHEESLKSNMRNKRKQSDPKSSRPRQNSSSSPAPTSAFQSQARLSDQVQNHSMPSNQSLEAGLRYQSQPSESRISNNGNMYNNLPPSSFGNNGPSYLGNSKFQGGDMPSHNGNPSFQGQDILSHYANLGFQGLDMQSHNGNPSFHGQNMPYHIVNRGFQGRDMPSHNANLGFQGQDMPSHCGNTGFQGQDMSSLNVDPGFRGQNMASHSVNPGFQGRDMQPHNRNPGFQAREVPSHNVNQGFQEQDMTYPRQQSGYSYRGVSGDAQNGNYHNGHLLTVPQHRQSQNSSVGLQSSNTTVPSLGGWSSQNANMTPAAPPRDMPSQMQKPGIHGPDDFHSGTSPPQQHRSTLQPRDFQNSIYPNANMMPHVQNHYQGADMPQPIQNSEYRHDMRQAVKQVDNDNEGTLPGTVQPRDYQERDAPSDD